MDNNFSSGNFPDGNFPGKTQQGGVWLVRIFLVGVLLIPLDVSIPQKEMEKLLCLWIKHVHFNFGVRI